MNSAANTQNREVEKKSAKTGNQTDAPIDAAQLPTGLSALTQTATTPKATLSSTVAAPLTSLVDQFPDCNALDRYLKDQKLFVPLVIIDGSIGYNDASKRLLAEVGGLDGLKKMTLIFYQKFHEDPYLKQFLGNLTNPLTTHAARIAMYFAEMMGASGEPWSADCSRRPQRPEPIAKNETVVVNSRQRAHYAAWNSVTRPANRVGRRFKLDDCRVWMRLMFWSCRESGLANNLVFFSYFVRFIGHFIAIYEETARAFARHEAMWSGNPQNIQRYLSSDRVMSDVLDVPYQVAKAELSSEDAKSNREGWPHIDAIRA